MQLETNHLHHMLLLLFVHRVGVDLHPKKVGNQLTRYTGLHLK